MVAALAVRIASAHPYLADIATSVRARTSTPFFGHKNGNFQPSNGESVHNEVVEATGGTVSNGNVAVTTINDNDGIGAGSDTYTQYNGDGTTGDGWPAKTQWVSFVDMSVAL